MKAEPAGSPPGGIQARPLRSSPGQSALRRARVPVDSIEDHVVAQSIYLHDPDGNAIEVHVDTSDVRRTDPRAVASISPLTL